MTEIFHSKDFSKVPFFLIVVSAQFSVNKGQLMETTRRALSRKVLMKIVLLYLMIQPNQT